MRSGTIAFTLGVALCQQLAELPDPLYVAYLPVAALLAALSPRLRPVLLLGAGFLWATIVAHDGLIDRWPQALEGKDVTVEARVRGLPVPFALGTRFEADVRAVPGPGSPGPSPRRWRGARRVRLAWYGDPPRLEPGQRWRLVVRLRRPHGRMNPHGFDYERWLFRRGIGAVGYVRERIELREGGLSGADRLAGVRLAALGRLARSLEGERFAPLVTALAVGERSRIPDADWTVLRRTGTAHLMAISGLHIGLAAGMGFYVARWVWAGLRIGALGIGAAPVSALAALVTAAAYAAMAGFSLPTQRALVMVSVALAGVVLRRRVPASVQLAWALLVVVIWDPLAVLSAGFWLSFGAVAALIYGMGGRTGPLGWWWRWGRAQLVVALGLLPAMLLFFSAQPLGGVAANLVAVPWVGMVTVPLTLLGTALLGLWPGLADLALGTAAASVALLWPCLELLARVDPMLTVRGEPGWGALALAAAGVLMLLAPSGLPGRWLGLLCCLPLLLNGPARPPPGAIWLTVLDVGQGLAAVVETTRHALVYDTGPRFGDVADAGRTVLVPYLRGAGHADVDRVVLSHADLDHVGGFRSLSAALAVRSVRGNARSVAARAEPCDTGLGWEWDGVSFAVLHPEPGDWWDRNDGSCVLLVRSAAGTVLLPGDIEARAEAALVARVRERLAADVLVVPHHGSATSSSPAFLAAARPAVAVVSSGYRNRYGLPSARVLERLRGAGIRVLRTDRSGAVTVRMAPGRPPEVESHRRVHRRYWHNILWP